LWTETEANFEGEYYTLRNANNDPKPMQRPHPPIWIGIVLGKRVMPRLAAEVADGINIYNASDVAATELLASVEHYCRERGRDFNAIQKSRSVHVIMQDRGAPLELPDLQGAGPGSLPSVIGSAEELALERAATLDQQRQRMNRAKGLSQQLEVYSRITERHVIGSSDQVAAELVRIASAGFDQLIIQGLNSIHDLRRFAEKVMPMVKGRP
jgi:alkanesulfonate monooxygenase SsuD/methylene tetrahydromethanopterin reductase-like flavin-dependent oxidoreductase (luciferase family)